MQENKTLRKEENVAGGMAAEGGKKWVLRLR